MAYCNLDKAIYEGIGKYGIPEIEGYKGNLDFKAMIGFNYAKQAKYCSKSVGVHFCIDDYQFETIWNHPNKYIDNFRKTRFICSPDFSIYEDTPRALQIYNHYRKHWLAKFYQERGILVIPNIEWGSKESYDFCFDGEPKNSVVVVETCSALYNDYNKKLMIDGFEEMKKRLTPSKIICLTHSDNYDKYELEGVDLYINISTYKNKPKEYKI